MARTSCGHPVHSDQLREPGFPSDRGGPYIEGKVRAKVPMHALSLPTWWIHIASVLEWMLAIAAIVRWGERRHEPQWRWLALAMLPALISAMAACTWHLYDNTEALRGLVVFQAFTTLIGNIALAVAAWQLLPSPRQV